MTALTYGSVCSGIEAASVAWHPLGWRPAWFAEVDRAASAVLAYRFPHVPNHGDMTTLAARVRAREIPAPDVLVGGTPCQAFSVAGLRGGLQDVRGQLTLAFVLLADAIDEIRAEDGLEPVIIVWENVPGVLNHSDNPFGCFLGAIGGDDEPVVPGARPEHGRSSTHWTFDKKAGEHRPKWPDSGYIAGPERAAAWRVKDAQYIGLAQRRRRVFLVASAREGFDPAAILLEFDGVRRDSAPSREAGEDFTHPTAPCLFSSGRGVERTGDTRGQDPVVGVLLRRGMGVPFLQDGQPLPVGFGSAEDMRVVRGGNIGVRYAAGVAFGGNNQTGPIDVATACNAHGGPHGRLDFESETFIVEPICMAHGQAGAEISVGRAPTLTCNHEAPITVYGFNGRMDPCVYGDMTGTLDTDALTQCVGFTTKDHGQDAARDLAPTLRAMQGDHANGGGQVGVAYAIQERAVSENPNAGPDGIGVSAVVCAYTLEARSVPQGVAYSVALRGREGGGTAELGDDLAGCLRVSSGGGDKPHVLAPIIAFQGRGSNIDLGQDVIGTLTLNCDRASGGAPCVTTTEMAVRRLMPVECERLQGFPDGWTHVPIKPVSRARQAAARADTSGAFTEIDGVMWAMAADGPRYKQCGNSMATNVMYWIGARIDAALTVDADEFDGLLGHNGGPALDDSFEALL